MADLSTSVNPGDPAGPAAQPVATAAGLIGLPPYQGNVNLVEPYIYVTSGYDRRAMGPFKIFGFRDTGGDTDTQLGSAVGQPGPERPGLLRYCPTPCNVRTYNGNAGSELLFARGFDEGAPSGACGATPSPATSSGARSQPATSFEPCDPHDPHLHPGRWAGSSLAGPGSTCPGRSSPRPRPIVCGDAALPLPLELRLRSCTPWARQTGMAAYDLNSTGDDAYRIYRDQRISAVSMAADPAQGGGSRAADRRGPAERGDSRRRLPRPGCPRTSPRAGTGERRHVAGPELPAGGGADRLGGLPVGERAFRRSARPGVRKAPSRGPAAGVTYGP